MQRRFYEYFGVAVENTPWIYELAGELAGQGFETRIFSWGGGVSLVSIRRAARELAAIIDGSGSREIVLFGKSLGGAVATEAARFAADRSRIRRIVTVATPYFLRDLQLEPIPVTAVQSPADSYAWLGARVLFAGFGTLQPRGARVLELPDLRHSDFNRNQIVQRAGEKLRLFQLYCDLVAGRR